MNRLKIINLCPTGTQSTLKNSFAPVYPNKIVDDVLACNEIGITMVHLHARDEDGNNTHRKEVFQAIITDIKKHAPDLVIGVSLSGRYVQDKYLRAEVLSLRPDLGSLTMSSLNFPKSASINEPETIIWLIEEMAKFGVKPEIECFDSGMLGYTNYLIKKEILPKNVYINVIFGNLFNARTDLSTVNSILQNIPKQATVCFGGIGKEQLRANVLGLLEVNGVRVGLEDSFYDAKNELTTNCQLVKRTHYLMENLNMSLMDSSLFKSYTTN